MAISKIQTLSTNAQGKSVNKDSYVEFKTWKQNNPTPMNHAGNLNENTFSAQITDVLLSMKKGQKVELKVENSQRLEQMVLELVEVRDGQAALKNYQKAEIFKNQGNEQIKLKDYQKAAQLYEQGLKLVHFDCSPQSQPVKISLLGNLALAYLNTKKYEECLTTCDQHLACSPQANKKVVHRRATANKYLCCFSEAEIDIKFGLQLCQNDPDAKKDFEILSDAVKKEKKAQADKEKKVYSKMFG